MSRMPCLFLLCAAFAVSAFALSATAEDRSVRGTGAEVDLGPRIRAVNQLFVPWDKTNSPGIAIVIVKDGKIVFHRGFGMADIEAGRAITPATVFDAASLAKQFTGFAISTLIEQQKLAADDDVRKYLRELPDFGKVITISHLLHHTSGLRDWGSGTYTNNPPRPVTLTTSGIVEMVTREKALDFDPGDKNKYCNTGYNLLAAVVERVTKQPLRIWMNENVFKPLSMTCTQLRDDLSIPVADMAYSYQTNNAGGFVKRGVGLAPIGSSSLYISADDFAKWLANFDTARVGGTTVLARMQVPGALNNGNKVNYGFGLFLGEFRGRRMVTHNGCWGGCNSSFWYVAGDKLGVVVLSNTGAEEVWGLATKIATLWLAECP